MPFQLLCIILLIELYCLGFFSFLIIRHNLLISLIIIEVMLLVGAVVLAFSGRIYESALHEMFVLIIITVAAAESAVGLILLISLHYSSFINFNKINIKNV